jgi:SAM-dependent methyltransferase
MDTPNLRFDPVAIEDLASTPDCRSVFDLVIANMLFQNVENLDRALRACVDTLAPAGALVFALPHPCFWPRYWGYEGEPWFHYQSELWIDAPFRISLEPDSDLRTTHAHRPLARYMAAFGKAGLIVEDLQEPMPAGDVEEEYPAAWQFPRFLLGRCRRAPE